MQRARKNKRGDRGSTEEETSTAKKSNMADQEEKDSLFSEKEPTLLEIKDLLVSIQATVSKISLENQVLKKELTELKDSMAFNEKELQDIKDTVKKVSKANASIQKELVKAKEELEQTKQQLDKEKEETERVWCALDDLEQYTRKNSLEIHGIPEHVYSDTESAVIKIANALDVSIQPDDIEITHKLKGREGKRPIIVKFCSHKAKSKLYKERIKLRNFKISDIFPSFSITTAASNQDRIYINENLTQYRRDIVKEANQRKRNKTLTSVWTLDGKIFVKTSQEGQRIRIFSMEDLENI